MVVDQQVKATGWIFIFDLCIFFIYVLVFFAIRGRIGNQQLLLPNWKGEKRELDNSRFCQQDLRASVADELDLHRDDDRDYSLHTTFREITLLEQSDNNNQIQIVSPKSPAFCNQVKMEEGKDFLIVQNVERRPTEKNKSFEVLPNMITPDGFKNPYYINEDSRDQSKFIMFGICILVLQQVVRKTFATQLEENFQPIQNRSCCKMNACKGLFNWFKVLWNITDDNLIEINGIEYTLYLVFLRYASLFFYAITILNLVCFIPIYLTGTPNTSPLFIVKYETTMNNITVINVTSKQGKMAFTYFSSLFLVSGALVFTLQKYRKKYESWKKKRDPKIDFKTDADVAHYSVMIHNLPDNQSPEVLQKRITAALQKIYNNGSDKGSFVKARVIGNYEKLYSYCVELKQLIEKLKSVHIANSENEVREIKKVRNCYRCQIFCCVRNQDAEEYYENKVLNLKKQIQAEMLEKQETNTGKGFLMFTDDKIVNDLRFMGQKYFSLKLRDIEKSTIRALLMNRWQFLQAPAQSDIIWKCFNIQNESWSLAKSFFLLLILFVVSVILITPTMLINLSTTIIQNWHINFISIETLKSYVQTACVLLVNVILIPFFIDMMVLVEDFETKSDRQLSILNRNFVFMIINTVLIPLTGTFTIKQFILNVGTVKFYQIPAYLSQQLTNQYLYFLQYLIQLMFLSVGFWLIDLPHLIVTSIQRCLHKNKERPFVDNYAFDLGYHMSYCLTVLLIGLLFGSIVPIIPAFCGIFFSFKYYVDKYNLSFVYHSEFLGTGKLKKQVIPYVLFLIILMQLITIGYFNKHVPQNETITPKMYFWFGIALILLELMAIGITRYGTYKKRRMKYLTCVESLQKTKFPSVDSEAVLTESINEILNPIDMSEANVKQLACAYRHPFEYISPKLYNLSDTELFDFFAKETQHHNSNESVLFVQDESEYEKQMREYTVINLV